MSYTTLDTLRRNIAIGELNFEGGSLQSQDLSGIDLENVNLRYSSLDGANLSYTHLSGADFSGASVTDINLTGAYFSPARLPTWVNRVPLKRIVVTGAIGVFRWTLLETIEELRFRFGCVEDSVTEWNHSHIAYAREHTTSPAKWAAVTKATLEMALRFIS